MIPGPKTSLIELLDDSINADQKKDRDFDFFPLRPSAAGQCARKLAYDLSEYRGITKYPKKILDPNVVRLLSLGHGVEYSAFKHFEQCQNIKLRYKQQTVSLFKLDDINEMPQEIIEGSIDAVFYSPEWKIVVDIKSTKDKFSVAYQTKWDETLAKYNSMESLQPISENGWWAPDLMAFLDEVNDPFLADNFIQLNSYACSDFCKERGIDAASIIKYCKNDSRMYEIRFAPSLALYEYVKAKFNAVNECVTKLKSPELIKKEYVFGSMRCAFCPYQNLCWDGEDALKGYFKTFPNKKWPLEITKVKSSLTLTSLFEEWLKMSSLEDDKEKIETEIVKIMLDEDVEKIKLANGQIYMLKSLKDSIVLRRTKL